MMERLLAIPAVCAGFFGLITSANASVGVTDLESLTDPASDGGEQITEAEAYAWIIATADDDADESLWALTTADRLSGQFVGDAYSQVVQAARFRVEGLAISLRQAPGLSATRSAASAPMQIAFDPQGVTYDGVEIAYSTDEWSTNTGVALSLGADGTWSAELAGLPAGGPFIYAVRLEGPDGQIFWLNNGRGAGIYAGKSHFDYRFDLGAPLVAADTPAGPAFVRLVRNMATENSTGGTVVTGAEFSFLVEQMTWEGSSAVEQPDVVYPVLWELQEMADEGVEIENLDGMVGFLESLALDTATYPSAGWPRDADGLLSLDIWDTGAMAATIIYSTDGWNLSHVSSCTRDGTSDPLVCDLGYIPPGGLISYALALTDDSGQQRWIRTTLGNFFHEVPN
jgi:hypothetical protein